MLSLVQRGPPCSRWCYGLQPTRSHVYRGSVRPSRLVAVGRREYTAIHSPRRLCAINSASSNSRRPQFSGCSAGCPRGLQQSAPPLSSPVPSKGGEAATGGGSKPRHSLDIRSCLFADCSGSEKQIRSAILSGADAVALDVFSLSDGDELVEGVTRAAEIIEKYTPSYQLHYIQIDANLTQESPLLSTPSERQESLRKKLETFSQAHEKRNLSVDGLVLRNVQNANDILAVERVLASHADVGVTSFWKKRLSFIPVIETPSSYFNALEIAQSSDRNVALIGSSPLFAEYVECKDDSQNETIVAVKAVSTVAAHATGLVSLSGWQTGDNDPGRLSRLAREDRTIGFDGKVVLNQPDLVPFVNHLYSVQGAELTVAEELADLDGGTVRTEKDEDLASLTIQDPEARIRQFKGPPHRAIAQALLRKRAMQKPKIHEGAEIARILGSHEAPRMIRGEKLKYTTHERLEVGDVIRCPHEFTVNESWITMWQMLIYNPRTAEFSPKHQYRFGSARPVLPFSLAVVLCVGMAVSRLTEKARFHLGMYDGVMVRPLEAGDTFRAFFRVDKKSLTGDGYPIIDTTHALVNQDDKLMFSTRKKTMFPTGLGSINPDSADIGKTQSRPESYIRRHVMSKTTAELVSVSAQNLPVLTKGQIIVHPLVRTIEKSDSIYFSNLCRITNDFHTNFLKHGLEQILVPGPLVLFCAISNSLPDLGEPLYHELDVATHINKFNPGDTVGTLTYVSDVRPVEGHEALEEVTLKQLGLKNVDMHRLFQEQLPESLFSRNITRPGDYEKICRQHCPQLQRRIVVNVGRRLLRMKPGIVTPFHDKILKQEELACNENQWFV